MGMINGRTPGGASDVDIRGPHAGNGPGHKKHAGGHLAHGLLDSQVDAAFLDGFPNLSSVLGIPSKSLSISRYIAMDHAILPHRISRPRNPGSPGGAGQEYGHFTALKSLDL